jgi:hypothetical protein
MKSWFLVTASVALAVLHAAGAAELSAKEQEAARKLYNAKCARCHKFYDPAQYSDAEWEKWMTSMNKKARVKGAQADLLGRYLNSFRASGVTNATPPNPTTNTGTKRAASKSARTGSSTLGAKPASTNPAAKHQPETSAGAWIIARGQ